MEATRYEIVGWLINALRSRANRVDTNLPDRDSVASVVQEELADLELSALEVEQSLACVLQEFDHLAEMAQTGNPSSAERSRKSESPQTP